jgi:hypothetical protein
VDRIRCYGNQRSGHRDRRREQRSIANPDDYIYVDATAAVQNRITTPGSNNGLIITPIGGVNVAFDSKESTTTSHPAQLLITLSSSGTAGATGAAGAAGATGAAGGGGASPSGIPYSLGAHTGTGIWFNVNGTTNGATPGVSSMVIAPSVCKPSMTIYSYTGTSTTWSLFGITPSSSSSTWAATGSAILQFTTASGSGSSNSLTASRSVAQGTIMSLTSGGSTAGAAPGGGGFLVALSCQ